MGPAVVILDYDPIARIGDLQVRLETLALGVVFLLALLLAARIAVVRRSEARLSEAAAKVRLDDFLFVAVGIVPGAIVGGRIDHVLVHLDAYLADPGAIVDPARGTLGLALAVVGGVISGSLVARLLDAPLRAWWEIAAFPLLFALCAGKAVSALGGSGQGVPSDASYATAFVGAGPWGSLGPAIPSVPAQLFEGLAVASVIGLLVAARGFGAFERADGSILFAGIASWAIARGLVASTWRDSPVLGPLNAEQLILIAIVVTCGIVLVGLARHASRPASAAGSQPDWPSANARPRF